MKKGLKLPALQLTKQTGKGQSAGHSNQCLLHRLDLSDIDSVSLWRGGVDGLKVLLKGADGKWNRGRGGKSRGHREGERQQQKVELEVAACVSHSAWSSMTRLTCRAIQIEPLPIFSGARRSAPNLSLPSPKWSWSEKASGRGGGGGWREFSSETDPSSDALPVVCRLQPVCIRPEVGFCGKAARLLSAG